MNRDSKKSETETQKTKMLNYNEINNSDQIKYVNVLCMINSPPEDNKQEVTILRVGEKKIQECYTIYTLYTMLYTSSI